MIQLSGLQTTVFLTYDSAPRIADYCTVLVTYVKVVRITYARRHMHWLSGLQITTAITYIMALRIADYCGCNDTVLRITDYSVHNICQRLQSTVAATCVIALRIMDFSDCNLRHQKYRCLVLHEQVCSLSYADRGLKATWTGLRAAWEPDQY